MGGFLPLLIVVGCLAAVMGLLGLLAARVRRRGTAGAAVGAALASYEEAFRTTSYAAHQEMRAEADRRAPLPSPDGDRRPVAPGDGARSRAGRPAGLRSRPGRRGLFGSGRARSRGGRAGGRPGGR
ncbi:hypothetical protein [Streptomyces sp. NBC_00102]|uniref:hypothetical protein n=1 Tax=Streptomyces sp. NBC_00102 TaxID=2975652 RepID=UPI00224CDBDA|nr:hypothetical protein [Streptomyces sp. NBC_00102]MCX5395959.1 hypothetical protein [Streptomyces sp. NBC_00102]